MPLPKRTTWFFVIDKAKARIIESAGVKSGWDLIEEWVDEAARSPARDLERDRPPRGRISGTGEPFAIDARKSEHDKAGEAFLSARACDLEEAVKNNRFDQLVIAAPPGALGVLRKRLHADVTAKIIGVFDKDLTNETDHDLHAYFVDKLEHW